MLKILKRMGKTELSLLAASIVLVACQVWMDLRIPDYMSKITLLVKTEGSAICDILRAGGMMLLLTGLLKPLLPWCLAFAAGAMVFVAAGQLLPDIGGRHSSKALAAFALGFLLMMVLDIALG